ncbi:uncharacterized protein LOC111268356 [Varroa jacobsoni]|uniref:uncharacterized protein LOC111268356 n=1 Tax=Varroa jacobsoni TaxID=62625 RepID=UPI000BF83E02|nr:uncharacterized protein LOC111268356 [Varroa jacobsoni]XP_022703050.1 uncharacterized protein LOC111268356 [Varroa jacobsoni]XP_022703051.1 uncharacterized protein LOC111268356 [Varroa jacobsoni]
MLCRALIASVRLASSVLQPKAPLHIVSLSGFLVQASYKISMPPKKVKASSAVGSSTADQVDKVGVDQRTRGKRVAQKQSYKESDNKNESNSNEKPAPKTSKRKKKSDSSSEDVEQPKPKRSFKKSSPSTDGSKQKLTTNKQVVKTKDLNNAGDDESNAAVNYDKKGSLKIVSWNINGVRAWLPKGGLEYLNREAPDVFCIQETKCSDNKLPKELESIRGYKSYFLAGDKEGYSGVGILSKIEPLKVSYGIGVNEHDAEGRVITMEFEDFFLINAYVPNAGRGLVRLDYRMKWDKDFRMYLCNLKKKKHVILTGDLNVAHQEIDLANPKTNKRNAGFTQEERDGLTALLEQGFVDTFRKLYPNRTKAYTFWSYMMNARAKNIGWRLDYFIVSEQFVSKVIDNEIRDKVMGSDHCPIVLHIK